MAERRLLPAPTSGILFAHQKLPAVVIFCNEVKGKNARAVSRELGVQHKTAFVFAHRDQGGAGKR